jgi:hypothetical protein
LFDNVKGILLTLRLVLFVVGGRRRRHSIVILRLYRIV